MKGKEKGTKKVLYRRFQYRNCDDLAELLQDMAMKGWHFTQWKLGLEFEKGLPQKVCYRVEVFPDASNYDYLPEREALEYSEYCRAAGWALVDAKRKFCIFRQERPNAPEIVTEEERLSNIKKAEYWLYRIDIVICFLILWLNISLIVKRSDNLYELLFEGSLSLLILLWIYPFARMAGFLVLILRFWRQKQLIRQGIRPFYGAKNPFLKRLHGIGFLSDVIFTAFILFILLFFRDFNDAAYLTIYVITICLCRLFWTWKRPSRDDRTLYIVMAFIPAFFILIFAQESLYKDPDSQPAAENQARAESFPLLKEDYASTKSPIVRSRYEENHGILGMQRYYVLNYGTVSQSQDTGKDEKHITDIVCYRIYETQRPWLLTKMWEAQTQNLKKPTDCTKEWNSEKALHSYSTLHYYYIVYPGKMIVLDSLQPLTPEQMKAAAVKLSAA